VATETGPDLSTAADAITALMDDTCTITGPLADDRAPAGELDPVTLQIASDQPVEWYSGRCKVQHAGTSTIAKGADEGGAERRYSQVYLAIPLATDDGAPIAAPQPGMRATITSSRRSPALVGRVVRVLEVQAKTFQIQWKCLGEVREEDE
jgi:hypothetical protein